MKRYLPAVILFSCAALFLFGVVQLFELRFEAGDVYPPYSTLRADPLGAMAFYESLGKMPGMTVRRDFSISNRLPDDPGTTYVHLASEGYQWDDLPDDMFQNIKNFVSAGGRLVITYFPQTEPPFRFFEGNTNSLASTATNVPATNMSSTNAPATNQPPAKVKPQQKQKKPAAGTVDWVNLEDKWGFHESFKELPQDDGTYQPVTVFNQSIPGLPHALAWHSGLVFTNCDRQWRVVYARGQDPVLLERKFGRGSVVLASDSYFASNEALTRDRHADLLTWLVGANRQVTFDEAHFGITQTGGVATLMREYRLHGLAGGLLLLAILFIWKNSTSLAPPLPEATADTAIAGKDSAAGLVNLLRRNLSPRDILNVNFAEWKKSAAPGGRVATRRQREAEMAYLAECSRPAMEQDPVAAYRKISETLGTRKKSI